ncbi:CDP-diacylglycerol--glycerol-3-phosphate 3-phosphatidyltransferase [Sneathiella chinensis]|uniref:CDP-diacylglycerol--glycerol-3-phosphate 3-phosphatidyltransferase n=1 Tax=Sneathiella chinensis TaxID=349750 RepID=A0ABQ5U2A5_9PROT|nr:CDP-diacylglycerol--glycerol-3-phosphate 3-phosphatidyltransferase [Sneathiella chinensis]GLQ06247.1 CDP-diacylglycerol--glycerol-3-phosphate 3-phosphatidyltransferase [Sneathiella chinensis]
MLLSVPNLLTLSRIVVIPLLLASFYLPGDLASWVPLGLFMAAGITDFFDGYLARRNKQTSNLGRFLDPVADKLLVAAVLLFLAGIDRINGWAMIPAVIILCREIMVSGLREFLAELRVGMPVSKLAKWKTAVQILSLCFLLGGPAVNQHFDALMVGEILLWVAGLLTVWTGYDYLTLGLRHMMEEDR